MSSTLEQYKTKIHNTRNATSHEHDDSDPIVKAPKRPFLYNDDNLYDKKRRFGTRNDKKIMQELGEMDFEVTSPESLEIPTIQDNCEAYKEYNFNLRSGVQRGEFHRKVSDDRERKEMEVAFEMDSFSEAGYDADDEGESEL